MHLFIVNPALFCANQLKETSHPIFSLKVYSCNKWGFSLYQQSSDDGNQLLMSLFLLTIASNNNFTEQVKVWTVDSTIAFSSKSPIYNLTEILWHISRISPTPSSWHGYLQPTPYLLWVKINMYQIYSWAFKLPNVYDWMFLEQSIILLVNHFSVNSQNS